MGGAGRNPQDDNEDDDHTVVQFRPTELLSADLRSLQLPSNGDKYRPPKPLPAQDPVDGETRRRERRFARPKLRRSILVLSTLVVLGGTGVAAVRWFRSHREALTSQLFKAKVDVVEITTASPAAAQESLTATGYVVAQTVVRVGSKVVARVKRVLTDEGQHVSQGQVLFELDPTDAQSAILSAKARAAAAHARTAVAKANVKETGVQLDRERRMLAQGAVGSANADDLAARVSALEEQARANASEAAAADAEVGALTINLHDLTVQAPIDGMATTKPVSVGDIVGPTTTLVQLAGSDSLLVEVDVPESRLSIVNVGGPCEIVLDAYPGRRFPGQVMMIAPEVNRSKATATVKVRFSGVAAEAGTGAPAGVLAQMAARVSFLTRPVEQAELNAPATTVVPANAVVERGGAKVVFMVAGDTVQLVRVTLGRPIGDDPGGGPPSSYALLDGPPVGSKVVKAPSPTLVDGVTVKVGNL